MVKKIALALVLVIGSLFLSDHFNFITISSKESLQQNIQDKTSFKNLITGPITLHFLPWPELIIARLEVYLDDKSSITLTPLSIKLSFSNLLQVGNSLTFEGGEIIKAKNLLFKGDPKALQKFSNKKMNFNLDLEEARIITWPDLFLSNISLKFQDFFSTNGTINYKQKQIKYLIDTSQNKIKFSSKGLSWEILGDLLTWPNFNKASFNLLLDKEFFETNEVIKPVVEGKLLTFSGDLTKAEEIISLNNYKISGSLFTNPDLKLEFYSVGENFTEIQSFFTSSNLDLSFLNQTLVPNQFLQEVGGNIIYLLRNPQINFTTTVKLDKIQLKENKINNFQLELLDVMERLLVKKLELEIDDYGKINLSGLIKYNGIRTKFEGQMGVDSKRARDFYKWFYQEDKNEIPNLPLKLSSDFYAIQNYFSAKNLQITLGKSQILGSANMADIPYAAPSKSYFLQAADLNFNDFTINDKFNNYLEKLYLADKDRSGEEYFTLTSLHNGLRLFKNNFYLEGSFLRSQWNQAKISQLDLIVSIAPNHFNLEKATLKDGNNFGTFSLDFYLPILRPQIKIKLDFESLNKDYLMEFFASKIVTGKRNNFSANNYDLVGEFAIKTFLLQEGKKLDNLQTQVKLDRGNLKLEKMTFNLEEGQVDMIGDMNLTTINPAFNLEFNCYNLPGYLIPQTVGVEGGLWSAKGSVSGLQKTVTSINGKAQFEGAQALLSGFDLNKSIEILEGSYTKASKKKALDYYSQYGSTAFDKLKGSIEINNGILLAENILLNNNRIAGAYSVAYDPSSDEMKGLGQFAFINKLNKQEFRVKAEVANKNNIRTSKVDLTTLQNTLTE